VAETQFNVVHLLFIFCNNVTFKLRTWTVTHRIFFSSLSQTSSSLVPPCLPYRCNIIIKIRVDSIYSLAENNNKQKKKRQAGQIILLRMVVGSVVFQHPYCNMWFIIIFKLISTITTHILRRYHIMVENNSEYLK